MKILTPAQAKKIEELAVSRLADYIRNAGIKSIILGISGGLDSAIMAVIGLKTIDKLAKGNYVCNYIYDFIAVESHPEDLTKARALAKTFNFHLGEVDYTDWYRQSPIRLPSHQSMTKYRVACGNLKCRIRMLHLYDRAQLNSGVVLDTDDFSEFLMGFWTKHGDVGDVKVMQYFTKDEVRDLGEFWGVPNIILGSAPGDGLGVTDTNRAIDQLKMDYLKIDYVVSRLVEQEFDYNGSLTQLNDRRFRSLMNQIAEEISEPVESVVHVARQSIITGYKRIYGDDVAHLMFDRTEVGLPAFGTTEFNTLYLRAIQNTH